MFIEINMLPEDMRKKEPRFGAAEKGAVDLKKIPFVKIAIISLFLLAAGHITLFFGAMLIRKSIEKFDSANIAIKPEKIEADLLQSQVASIQKKLGAIDTLMTKRFSWTKKLNALGDSITPGIWLSELAYNEKPMERTSQAVKSQKKDSKALPSISKYITISGYASGIGEQGTAAVGKFIKSLKENVAFYDDFKDIELVTIKSVKVDEQEIMNFSITCLLKESE